MPWWRKSVRGFGLYSEDLLNSKVLRWIIIITHLIGFALGITAVIIGVFSYAQTTPGGATIQFVNCSLEIDLDSNIHFPVKLLLVLTGVTLVAVDVNISILFFLLKYCGCGGIVIVWYILECLCLMGWTAWSVFYAVSVFPSWQEDKAQCESLVVISTLVAVAAASFFTIYYLTVIFIVLFYEAKERLGCRSSCCLQHKYHEDD